MVFNIILSWYFIALTNLFHSSKSLKNYFVFESIDFRGYFFLINLNLSEYFYNRGVGQKRSSKKTFGQSRKVRWNIILMKIIAFSVYQVETFKSELLSINYVFVDNRDWMKLFGYCLVIHNKLFL